jgi:hypothetical protein
MREKNAIHQRRVECNINNNIQIENIYDSPEDCVANF